MTQPVKDELPRGVFERPPGSKIYWIRYADSRGVERREKVGPRLSVAVTLYQKRKTEAFESRKLPELRRRDVHFSELASDYLEYGRVQHTHRTQRVDRQRMEKLLQAFRDRTIESITPQDLVRFLGSGEWKPATRNRYRALLSKCFTLAVRNGRIKENPLQKVERFRENNARVRFLEAAEERKLRKSIADPDREPEFVLAMNTGMRRGEQFALKWSAVDLGRRQLTVEQSKNGERRHIPINDAALDALRSLRKRCMKVGSEYVVPATDSERDGNYPTWFEAAVIRAKIKNFHWHDLRHTFASRLVMAGSDIRTVQELMGHKTLTMTVRYSHLSAPHKREAVQSLSKYVPKVEEEKAG